MPLHHGQAHQRLDPRHISPAFSCGVFVVQRYVLKRHVAFSQSKADADETVCLGGGPLVTPPLFLVHETILPQICRKEIANSTPLAIGAFAGAMALAIIYPRKCSNWLGAPLP
ncbi:MAG TPA: hypothetical protein DCL54_06150 [Alphaproteobacteria bacterium]|nr:hypothetical protein [Alphaproteobacteria bacterium]